MFNKHSLNWIIVNLALPLLPFFLGAFIRTLVCEWDIDWATFSTATLSMSLGFVCLSVNQSITTHPRLLDDEEKAAEASGMANTFLLLAVVNVAFFALCVAFAEIERVNSYPVDIQHEMSRIYHSFAVFAYLMAPVVCIVALASQRSLKLRASYR